MTKCVSAYNFVVYIRYANGRQTAWASPEVSMAHSSTRVVIPEGNVASPPPPIPYEESRAHSALMNPSTRPLPMFGSHCPGWVCYAEKTNPQCIPYMSTAKSAQQVIGAIVKLILPTDSGFTGSNGINGATLGAQDIYHVSIQPCFDKKLEASRQVPLCLSICLSVCTCVCAYRRYIE